MAMKGLREEKRVLERCATAAGELREAFRLRARRLEA